MSTNPDHGLDRLISALAAPASPMSCAPGGGQGRVPGRPVQPGGKQPPTFPPPRRPVPCRPAAGRIASPPAGRGCRRAVIVIAGMATCAYTAEAARAGAGRRAQRAGAAGVPCRARPGPRRRAEPGHQRPPASLGTTSTTPARRGSGRRLPSHGERVGAGSRPARLSSSPGGSPRAAMAPRHAGCGWSSASPEPPGGGSRRPASPARGDASRPGEPAA